MDQVTLFRALGHLGVHPQDLETLRRVPFQQAVEGLKKLQDGVKPRYKKLALELHPDRTGGDAVKAQTFSEVTMAHKWLQDLRMEPAPPPPPQMTVRIQKMVFYPQAHPFGGTATSTATGTYQAARVVFIKVP